MNTTTTNDSLKWSLGNLKIITSGEMDDVPGEVDSGNSTSHSPEELIKPREQGRNSSKLQ